MSCYIHIGLSQSDAIDFFLLSPLCILSIGDCSSNVFKRGGPPERETLDTVSCEDQKPLPAQNQLTLEILLSWQSKLRFWNNATWHDHRCVTNNTINQSIDQSRPLS